MVKSMGKALGSRIEPFTKSGPAGSWLKVIPNMIENIFGLSTMDPQEVAGVVCAGPFSWIDPPERPKASIALGAKYAKRQ